MDERVVWHQFVTIVKNTKMPKFEKIWHWKQTWTKYSPVLPEFQAVGHHLGDALVHSGLAIVSLVFGSLCSWLVDVHPLLESFCYGGRGGKILTGRTHKDTPFNFTPHIWHHFCLCQGPCHLTGHGRLGARSSSSSSSRRGGRRRSRGSWRRSGGGLGRRCCTFHCVSCKTFNDILLLKSISFRAQPDCVRCWWAAGGSDWLEKTRPTHNGRSVFANFFYSLWICFIYNEKCHLVFWTVIYI